MAGKRRPKGEGSIFRRKSDGLWVGQVSTHVNGKRQRRTVTSRSRDECLKKLHNLKVQLGIGSDDPQTIDEKITGWREDARWYAKRAVEHSQLLAEESIDTKTQFIVEALFAVMSYAAALDAAYFGDLPEVVSDEWPGVAPDGEPELIQQGSQGGSVKQPNRYHIRTTSLPGGADGYNWTQFFASQFTGPLPISGYHDGSKAILECWPDDESELIETVDAAIKYANEQVKALKG